MPKIITTFVFLFVTFTTLVQVGVGTTNPVGKLTVDASADTTAALQLVPQATPTTNLSAGQIAVIGDKAYMYDTTRMKWLSLETVAISFGRNNSATNNNLLHGGNMNSNASGPLLPFDGTIVAITAKGSAGDDTDVQLRTRDNLNTNVDETFTLNALESNDTATNFDFDAGDYITIRARDNTTTTENLVVTVFVKWRQ